jgi:hypothetical protein
MVGTDAELDVDVGVLDADDDVAGVLVALVVFECEFELPHAATATAAVIASDAVTALPLSKCTIGLLCWLV